MVQVVALSATLSLVVGFIWYHPKVFGTAWMNITGITPDPAKRGNMLGIFAAVYIMSFFAAFVMGQLCIHQMSVMSVIGGGRDTSSPAYLAARSFLDTYGTGFRTFKHGALHGALTGVFFATPIIGIPALFESRGWKYIALHAGYWIVTLALIGGVVCAFAPAI